METRTVQLSQSAIDSAILAYRNVVGKIGGEFNLMVSENCPIFHSLNEAGIPVKICGLAFAETLDGKMIALDGDARSVTHLPAREWEFVHPMKFTVEIPE